MWERLAQRLGLQTNPAIFFISAGLMILFLALLLLFREPVGDTFTSGREWVVTNLGWFFILGVSVWLVFLLLLAISRFGRLRLGDPDSKPEYSNMSWFAMLFAGGIGTVLMFWGVAEPMSHFTDPPRAGVAPYSAEAAQDAMAFSLYHLGLHTWTIFALPGLAFGFFIHRYRLPMRVSSVFYPFLKEKIHGPIGRTIDIFAILGTLFGLAVSIGLGTQQMSAGIAHISALPNAVWLMVAIVALVTVVATTSIAVGMDKGVKRLSNLNINMAIGLMVFIVVFGSTVFLARQTIESIGLYAQNIVPLAFWNDALAPYTQTDGWGWQGAWTVFYWAWTVTWSPFMGIFLARISRGRTVREFILTVLFAPTAFTLAWFTVFGWSAMDMEGINGEGGPISEAVSSAETVPLAIFEFLEHFPLTGFLQVFAVIIVFVFLITSSDSASLVVDMLCTGSGEAGPVRQRVFWAVSEGAVAASLIWLGGEAGIEALQEVITVIGLPIFIMVFLMMFALIKALGSDKELRHSLRQSQLQDTASAEESSAEANPDDEAERATT